jgi:hypothetical protein
MLRRTNSGQALILAVAFTALLAAASLLVFNVGQTVNDKMRLQNAADAAAYSAAVWEARSLNFQSYVNRALVANEVAIAQLISLRSWSQYMTQTLSNSATVGRWVPPAAATLQALSRGWSAVDGALQQVLPPAEAALSHWNLDVLSTVQVLAQQQAPIVAADLVSEVAKVYDPRIQVGNSTRLFQVANANTWETGLSTRYRHGSSQRGRFSNLLMDARDGFTANRRADLLPANPLLDLRKRGGTDLLGEYSWRGLDSLSLHVNYFFGSSELALGWGGAENRRLPMTLRGEAGGSWRDNARGTRLADRGARVNSGYGGIPEFRDIVRPQTQQDVRLTYTVDLLLPRTQMRLAEGADTEPRYVGDALHALSSAELYFRRPVGRADGRLEYPSLFNPYWQAHLIEVTRSTRVKAAPLRGLKVDPYAVLP